MGGFPNSKLLEAVGKHPFYRRWICMHGRCYSPRNEQYRRYGAKGVRVEWEWSRNNYLGFANYMQWIEKELNQLGWTPGSTFEVGRKDPKGNFSPDNCIIRLSHIETQQSASRCVLTFDKVVEIRQYARVHPMTSLKELAALFSLKYRTLVSALNSQHWANVDAVEPRVLLKEERKKESNNAIAC